MQRRVGWFGHDQRRQLFCDRDFAQRAHGRDPHAAFPGPRRHARGDRAVKLGLALPSLLRIRREFSEEETDYFLDIDFVNHVALVAEANDAGQPTIVGGGRYVVIQPGQAEVAFAIVDAYQGLGIGSALMRHLATLGREAGLRELVAEVLSENVPMLNVFERSGLTMNTRREGPVVHVTLRYS
jgi:RimJ/RimL family protein N-acetyltransferase